MLCSNSGIATAVKVTFTTGAAVGAFVVGVISDKYVMWCEYHATNPKSSYASHLLHAVNLN